jgi:hypothetical protein
VKRLAALVLHARTPSSRTLSYQSGWPRQLAASNRLDATVVDVASRRGRIALLAPGLERRFEAVILLHSIFSNELALQGRLLGRVRALRLPKALFLGNEYKLLPEKTAFAEELGVTLLVSQILSPDVHELYRRRLGCAVIGIPNTGLDPELFAPRVPWDERPIDVGYRSYAGPAYLGHREREALAEAFLAAGPRHRLRVDVSLDPSSRFDEHGWADFLNRCKGQLGYEAGTDRFELDDATRNAVNAYYEAHPDAGFDEIQERFFRDGRPAVSGRTLSSRVIEAAGTKTVQLLVEGAYGGYFQPDVHYVPLRADVSNADEAIAKLRDRAFALSLAENAHRVAIEELTYERLIARLVDALA